MVGHRLFYTVSKLFITVFSPTHSALIHNITQLRYYYIIPLACHLLLDIGNNVKLKRNIICVTSKSHCEHIWFHLAPNTFNCVYIISTSSSVIGANTTFRIFIFSVALCHTYEKSTDQKHKCFIVECSSSEVGNSRLLLLTARCLVIILTFHQGYGGSSLYISLILFIKRNILGILCDKRKQKIIHDFLGDYFNFM